MRINKHTVKRIISLVGETTFRALLYRKSLLLGLLVDIGVSVAQEVADRLLETSEDEWEALENE